MHHILHIELTEQERLLAQQGQPIDVIDPQTNEAYVVIARQRFDQVRPLLNSEPPPRVDEIAEGIRLSQEAFRRDLPALLEQKKFYHHWVAYHRHERIGIVSTGREALDECIKRGLADDEFFVGWIDPCGLEIEEEIEPRLHHYDYEGCEDEDS